MLKELGTELLNARKRKRSSLADISGQAGISATYLQKLERGEINNPSPRVLARLALALDVPYLHLMELAGYLDEELLAQVRSREPSPHPLAGQRLTPEEWKKVSAYIILLLAQRKAQTGDVDGT